MSKLTRAQRKAKTALTIKINGNKKITPPKDKILRDDEIDSVPSLKDGGMEMELAFGYSTELDVIDPKAFVRFGQTEAMIAAAVSESGALLVNGSTSPTKDINWGGKSITHLDTLTDIGDVLSIEVYNRVLYDDTIKASIDWRLRNLLNAIEVQVAKWSDKFSVTSNGKYASLDTSLLNADHIATFPNKDFIFAGVDDIEAAIESLEQNLDPVTPGLEDGEARFEKLLDEVKSWEVLPLANGTDIADKALLAAGTPGDWVNGHFTGTTLNSKYGQFYPGQDLTNNQWYMYYCYTANNWYRIPLTIALLDAYTKSESDARYVQLSNVDATPTTSSVNPVQSGGVKTYVDTLETTLKGGVPSGGDTFNKLYNLIYGRGTLVGDFDASAGVVPTTGSGLSGAIKKGDYYDVTVGGTIIGLNPVSTLKPFDVITARIDGASTAADFYATQGNADQATSTVLGLIKLYTDLSASNVDGSVTQAAIVAALTAYVTKTGAETLTNKTLTSPIINVGSDATGDIYYRSSGGLFTRLAASTNGFFLSLAAGVPSWQDIAATVRSVTLTGVSFVTAQSVTATDSVLQAIGYIQAQLNLLNADRVYTVKVSLTSAQILALNTTPIQLVAAPGVGKMIELLGLSTAFTFVSSAYTTNLTLNIYQGSSAGSLASNASILSSTVTRKGKILASAVSGATASNEQENAALMVNVTGGNPLAGNGTLDIYITYKIITL